MLKNYLDRQAVKMCSAKDWQEAIEKAAQPLIEEKKIEPAYLQRTLENVRQLGAYIVLAKGIAVAHARPGEDVSASCVSMMGLEQPIPFGHKQYDPVHIVLMMAAPDDTAHIQLMMEIAQKLSQTEVMQTLEKAENEDQLFAAMTWGEE